MSEGESDGNQARKIRTKTIGEKLIHGTERTKSLFSFARIYRVPEDLRKLNESAYIPRLIAIGPLHRNDPHLQTPMQDVKMHYANHLFLRLTAGTEDEKIRDEKKDKLIQECVETMMTCVVKAKKYYAEEEVTLLEKAKKYYGEELELNDDDMVEMMLVDGCFILELLYHTKYCQVQDWSGIPQPTNGVKGGSKSNSTSCEQPRADPILDNILTANIVKHDLILLENQIPFFVLEHLFELTVAKIPMDHQITGCPGKLSLECYVRLYFGEFLPDHVFPVCGSTKGIELGKPESGKANDYYHILHLIHRSYIPGEQAQNNELERIEIKSTLHSELTLSASDLRYAGVKFVPTMDLFDVKFIDRGIFCCFRTLEFRIPTLSIRNTTESFLRNLIALEQCSPAVSRYFTSYAKLMDMFINSEEDVRVLIKKEIVHNYLSTDKDVCDLFNKLCNEVVLEDFHFDEVCKRASTFNMHWRTRAVRYVKRLFVASPWAVLGFILGIVTVSLAIYNFSYSIHTRLRRHR